jgi:hypothetical protein
MHSLYHVCRDSSVSKVTGYGMDVRSSVLGKDSDSSLRHHVHTDSGTYPATSPVGTGAESAGVRIWLLYFI